MRYSFQKTHRVQPASLPHGDAGVTFGAGDGNVKAQGVAVNDTHIIKNTKIGSTNTEIRVEAFNVLNHPQFANPNTTLNSAGAGTISAMLSNPSCSLCGTTERQIQLGLKVRF